MTDGLRERGREEELLYYLPEPVTEYGAHRFEITIEKLTDVLAHCDVVLEVIPF